MQCIGWLTIVADYIFGSEYNWNQNRQVGKELAKEQFIGKPGFEPHLLAKLEPRVVITVVMWISLVE